MKTPKNERELLTVAISILDGRMDLTPAEKKAIRTIRTCNNAGWADHIAELIRAGQDPLGEWLCLLRSPEERRDQGQTFTPSPIVQSMLARAELDARNHGPFVRVVDAGAGSGRFLLAVGRLFPGATLIAIEADPVCAILLRANLAAAGLAGRSVVLVEDFRSISLPTFSEGRTLFIGNPPYVRHHDIDPTWKTWYANQAADLGSRGATKLAGLHAHFFVKTARLAQPGDLGVFITAAEWLENGYGEALRNLLCGSLGGISVHIVDARAEPFPGVLATAAVTVFKPWTAAESIRLKQVSAIAELQDLSGGRAVSANELQSAKRWSASPPESSKTGGTRVGDLFRVSRGQVTGCNKAWVAGDEAANLPERFLIPCITGAREIFDAHQCGGIHTTDGLKKVVALPKDLNSLPSAESAKVRRFLEWAKRQGADQSYVAQHRNPWWSVKLHDPAPIVCTYMARRPPAFVRNHAGARLLNIAHGLYPKVPLTDEELNQLCAELNRSVLLSDGRTYAGGLTKFEPSSVEDLVIDWPPGPCNRRSGFNHGKMARRSGALDCKSNPRGFAGG